MEAGASMRSYDGSSKFGPHERSDDGGLFDLKQSGVMSDDGILRSDDGGILDVKQSVGIMRSDDGGILDVSTGGGVQQSDEVVPMRGPAPLSSKVFGPNDVGTNGMRAWSCQNEVEILGGNLPREDYMEPRAALVLDRSHNAAELAAGGSLANEGWLADPDDCSCSPN